MPLPIQEILKSRGFQVGPYCDDPELIWATKVEGLKTDPEGGWSILIQQRPKFFEVECYEVCYRRHFDLKKTEFETQESLLSFLDEIARTPVVPPQRPKLKEWLEANGFVKAQWPRDWTHATKPHIHVATGTEIILTQYQPLRCQCYEHEEDAIKDLKTLFPWWKLLWNRLNQWTKTKTT